MGSGSHRYWFIFPCYADANYHGNTGSGASAIMMFIPPRSARKAIRLENASMIFRFSQLYGMLISEWIDVEEKSIAQEKIDPNRSGTYWSEKFRKEYIKVATNVQTLQTRTTLAKWEGSFRGAWPVEEYKELSEIQAEMLSYLAQVSPRFSTTLILFLILLSSRELYTIWILYGGSALCTVPNSLTLTS